MDKELKKTMLFGLHKKTTDQYLRKLRHLQETELRELKAKVDEAGARNRRLNEQLKGLRSLHRQEKAKEIMGQAVRDANEQEQAPVPAPPVAERPALKVITMTPRHKAEEPAAIVGEPTVQVEEPTIKVEEPAAIVEEPTVKEEEPAAIVEEPPVKAEEPAAIVEEPPAVAVLSDRESPAPSEPDSKELVPARQEEPLRQEEAIGVAEDADALIDSEQYWGTINHYMDMDLAPVEQFLARESERQPLRQTSPSPLAETETAAGLEAEPEAATLDAPEEPQDDTPDPEIESIKRNYIVGKIAGESLADGSGRIIVAKDAVITEQAVRRAQREGKLAELIVNMKFPSSGD